MAVAVTAGSGVLLRRLRDVNENTGCRYDGWRHVEQDMLSRRVGLMGILSLSFTAGCIAGGEQTGASSVQSDGRRPDEPLDPAAVLLMPSELSPGQRVELWRAEGPAAGRAAATAEVEGHPIRRYSGTIVRTDAAEVELRPAAQLLQVAEVSAVPVLGRVPYINRAFRKSRVQDQLQPVDGSVVVPRNELVAAWDLSAVSEDRLLALRPPERIGVDFDAAGHEAFLLQPQHDSTSHEHE